MSPVDLLSYIRLATVADLIDILLISGVIYYVLYKIRGTSAERLVKGIAFLFVGMVFSVTFEFNTVNYLLDSLTQVGLIAIVVVFQPELRQILERLGKTKWYRSSENEEMTEGELIIEEICDACDKLSKAKEGALIVFERDNNLKEIIESGVHLDAKVTSALLRNIFSNKAPLHDGAIVISDSRIEGASCILPLSKNQSISRDLGTRHRAAIGITEITDSLAVIVSEETGAISVANKGMLKRHLSDDMLKKMLRYELIGEDKGTANSRIFNAIDRFLTKVSNVFKKKEN